AMERAWTARKRLGGGMRQAGILAAAGLHALDGWREVLTGDHRRARLLAEGARSVDGLSAPEPETNIVLVGVEAAGTRADDVAAAAEEAGLRVLATGERRLRAVTHRDVDDADVERAVDALRRAVGRAAGSGGEVDSR
ncbi:MAG: beta-eliminating lyase-related protein, partial [Gemmatimonadota bacterium]